MSTQHKEAHRDTARDFAKHGIAEFARAFNHCHNPKLGYRYSPEVQRRFLELGAELIELVERGEIVSRNGARSQTDQGFQKLMAAVICAEPQYPAA